MKNINEKNKEFYEIELCYLLNKEKLSYTENRRKIKLKKMLK